MAELDAYLFLVLNADASSPGWMVRLARFASLEIPEAALAALMGAFIVADEKQRRRLVAIVLAMVTAWICARLVQYLLPLPRPFAVSLGTQWQPHRTTAGFPSTHATVAFALATSVALHCRFVASRLAMLLLATLVAWSRVCLGLHFPLDALAGAGIGALCGRSWSGKPKRQLPLFRRGEAQRATGT